jgi:DNA processing protein
VIESASKGGALVTANYANEYNKEVFAVPGRMNDVFSAGCNDLIRQNKAALFSSPIDLCEFMNWKLEPQLAQLVLPELTNDEKKIFNVLRKDNPMEVDSLRYKVEMTNLPSVLLQMELKGILRYLPGNKVELT